MVTIALIIARLGSVILEVLVGISRTVPGVVAVADMVTVMATFAGTGLAPMVMRR